MFYVYSTLTATNIYAVYAPLNFPEDQHRIEKKIVIKGGSNLMPLPQDGMQWPSGGIVSPLGIMTEISDDDMELLEKDYHFQQHVKNGFINVMKKPGTSEKAVADMEKRDQSAPKTPEDYPRVEGEASSPPVYKEKGAKRK